MIKGHPAHPTRLLAKVRTGPAAATHAAALSANDLSAVRGFALVPGLVVLELDPRVAAAAAATIAAGGPDLRAVQLQERIAELRRSGLYEFIEPDYLVSADAVPNDTRFTDGTLWGLRNTGQSGGIAGVDIDAVRAWDITTGSTGVVVGVIDSGIRYTHFDLSAQMWRNPGEIAGNGVDDDHNGYVDDVFGINSITGSGNPMDDDGHGTHVAGTIGAAANNGQPHVGVAWNVRLMALKFLSSQGGGATSDAIECINYAVAKGVRILNNSWGGGPPSDALKAAILAARDQGVLFVAAAGNESENSDINPHYPASYDLDNIIAVAGIDRYGSRYSATNYGTTSVDLGAPAVQILSTDSDSDTDYLSASGTSMAAPHVSGVAALVLAQYPGIPLVDLRDRILQTTTATASLQGFTATGGRVNAYQALSATPTGALKISVAPQNGSVLINGRASTFVVRVTDLFGVTGATVTGTVSGGPAVTFLDDGVAPDAVANDSFYTAIVNTPASGAQLALSLAASAPGKTAANADPAYPLQPPPPNDNFADRITLNFNNGSTTANNFGATREPGEPLHANDEGDTSLWWTWTPSADTSVTITTIGSNFDTMLAVYTGSSVDALAEVASNDDIDGPNQPSKVEFTATAGTTYQIAVVGWGSKTGNITLNLVSSLPPVNDNFADAIVVDGSSLSIVGDNTNATREPGEPMPPANGAMGENSLWWTWTAPSTGTAVLAQANGSLVVDVGVFAGDSLDELVRVPGLVSEERGVTRGRITFAAIAGTTYRLAAWRIYSGVPSKFTLTLSLTAGPDNDLFENAATIIGASATIFGNNTNATQEIGEPNPNSEAVGSTVWWKWTAPSDGTLTVTTAGSALGYPQLAAYHGDTLATATLIATPWQFSSDLRLRFSVVAGVTYHISVDGRVGYPAGAIALNLSLGEGPANDLFANRITVTGESFETTGSNVGAARELGEPIHHPHASGAAVWWTWTAPRSGTALLRAGGGNPLLAVYTGDELATLVPVPNAFVANDSVRNFQFAVQEGTTYQIAVDGYFGAETAIALLLSMGDRPANDDFDQRATLAGAAATVAGTNVFATREAGENGYSATTIISSVWWTWTAPANGNAVVTLEDTTFMAFIAVSTGASLSSLTAVSNQIRSSSSPMRYVFSATAGTSYQIAIGSRSREAGTFTLMVQLVDPPANDHFAGRISISGDSVTVAGSNVGATHESFEPSVGPTGSVWWTWTAPATGTARATTIGSDFNTAIGIYTGTDVSALTSVGANDNESTSVFTSRVNFGVQAGVSYHIAVDGSFPGSGNIQLHVEMIPPAPNDQFSQRTAINGANLDLSASNLSASAEPGETSRFGYPPNTSAWWSWTAPSSGTASISVVSPQGFSAVLAVYTGASLASLVPVANSEMGSSPSASTFHAEAGTTYNVVVDSSSGPGGDFTLRVLLYDAPANDMFVNRSVVSGSSVDVTVPSRHATREPGEPSHAGVPVAGSLWWTWTAPHSGKAVIHATGGTTSIAVYTGDHLGGLVPIASTYTFFQPQVLFDAVAGTTYQFATASQSALSDSMRFTVDLALPPANDAFAGRSVVTGASIGVSASNVAASADAGDPSLGYVSPAANLWWSWTAPADGRAIVTVSAVGFMPVMGVFTGAGPGELSPVNYTNGSSAGLGGAVFGATAGTTYFIVVDGYNGGRGRFDLKVVLVDAPTNDQFANRVSVSGSDVVVVGSNLGATAEPGEPNVGNLPATSTVWWSWTAPTSGVVVVSSGESDFDAAFGVFTGSSVASLAPVEMNSTTIDLTHGRQARFFATAGTTYQFAVNSLGAVMGRIALRIGLFQAPANDQMADHIALTGVSVVAAGHNLGATRESLEPNYYPPAIGTVWWSWTAPATERVAISTHGSDFDTTLNVFYGPSLSSLFWLANSFDVSTDDLSSRVVFDATVGMTYFISVDGAYGAMGEIKLTIAPATAPEGAAIVVTTDPVAGSEVTLAASTTGIGPISYQWMFDGKDIPGANAAELTIPSVQQFMAGSYAVRLANEFGSSTSTGAQVTVTEPPPSGARLTNLSTRARVLTGDHVVIPGFVIAGPGNKQLLIRNVGPTLGADPFNLPGVLPNPRILLKKYNGSTYDDLLSNDDWGTNANAPEIITKSGELFAFPLLDGSADSALLVSLEPGQYTVIADDTAGQTGIAVVEFYDADAEDDTNTARLINISTRGYVGVGDNIMIPGFVVSHEGPKTLLIRVVGPTLALPPFNLDQVLADPQLTIYRHDFVHNTDEAILANDNWGDSPVAAHTAEVAEQVFAFALPGGSKDAAFVVTLNPGVYTVHARGVNDTTGVALVEVYAVP